MHRIWETSAESASERCYGLNIVGHANVQLLGYDVFVKSMPQIGSFA
jgi:hypothetical protein